ncbi:MAG: VOC family protein [Pseudomonadota bacterium]
MSKVSLGIDHPVVTVRDLARAREQYRRLGFAPNPVGFHPWGTTLSLLMFKDNFIELISVSDSSKFGSHSGGFCYGRNVSRFLERVEGLGLVALHSKDGRRDHARLVAQGLKSQGLIDFRRELKKPDGSPDEAVVTLGLFLNEEQRDVSQFICHQHRPDLVWMPEWQHHPNGVEAVSAVTYLAENPLDLLPRFLAFYGDVAYSNELLEVDTGCGTLRAVSPVRARQMFGDVPLPDWGADPAPHGIAISVSTPLFSQLESLWVVHGIKCQESPSGSLLVPPQHCGNVLLEFVRSPPTKPKARHRPETKL